MTPEAAADCGRIEDCPQTINKQQIIDIRSSLSDKKSVPISSKHENLKYKRENDVDLLFSDRIIPTDSSIFWKWLFETQLTKGSEEFLQFIAQKVSKEKKLLYEVHTHNFKSYLNNFLQYNGDIFLSLICGQIMELKAEDLNKLEMLETFLNSIQLLLEYCQIDEDHFIDLFLSNPVQTEENSDYCDAITKPTGNAIHLISFLMEIIAKVDEIAKPKLYRLKVLAINITLLLIHKSQKGVNSLQKFCFSINSAQPSKLVSIFLRSLIRSILNDRLPPDTEGILSRLKLRKKNHLNYCQEISSQAFLLFSVFLLCCPKKTKDASNSKVTNEFFKTDEYDEEDKLLYEEFLRILSDSNDYCTLGLSLLTKSESFSRRFVQYLMNNPKIIMKLFDEIKRFNIDKDSAFNALCIISLHASNSDFLQFINSETLYIQIESFSDESPPNIISNILYVLVSILLVNIQNKGYYFHDLHALNLSTILSLSHHAYLLTNSFAHTYFLSLGKLIDKYEKCNQEITRDVCSPERRMQLVEKDLVFASILKSMMEFIVNIIRHGRFNLHFIWNLLRNEHLFLQLLNIVERKKKDEDRSESLDMSNGEFILNYIVRLKTLLIDYKIFDITDGEMNEHQSNNLQPAIDNLDIEIPKNVRYFKFEKSSMLFSFHNIAWKRVELHSHLKIQ